MLWALFTTLLVAMTLPIDAFVKPHPPVSLFLSVDTASTWTAIIPPGISKFTSTSLYSEPDDNNDLSQQDKLSRLGYRPEEIQTSNKRSREEPVKVQVNEVANIDAATLTVVGFGLIAFNFFVLANLGDGGIAGTVATVINLLKE